ncbi:MAG: hypothetical protein CSA44_01940 [Gammaproteobacteria bacterium]|nr:MAG: hypothetical protein CSA44_01940 [Gammaproteobacteria bacterium]
MKKILLLATAISALSFLSACSEDKPEQKIEKATESMSELLKEQKSQFDQSIKQINESLNQLSSTYEKGYQVDETEIQGLADQLETLARQAGQGAKLLENTTKVLGEAIQKGFEEGYNQSSD